MQSGSAHRDVLPRRRRRAGAPQLGSREPHARAPRRARAGHALQRAEPHAERIIDHSVHIGATSDAGRAWQYMDLVLQKAGVGLSDATDAAPAELRGYHAEHNLWEHVADV